MSSLEGENFTLHSHFSTMRSLWKPETYGIILAITGLYYGSLELSSFARKRVDILRREQLQQHTKFQRVTSRSLFPSE
jgi:hypothetical protein